MDKKKILNGIKATEFKKNNGIVLISLNILSTKYTKLESLYTVFETRDISRDEFLEAIDFLSEEGYIHLRNIENKKEVILADSYYKDIEAKLTGKAHRLLNGGISDNMIEV